MNAPYPDDLLPDQFDQHLLAILESDPAGIDEYALIKRLAGLFPDSLFNAPDALRDPLRLFQVHFLLFHSLYRLSDALCRSGRQLEINTLRIVIVPRPGSKADLTLPDPLRVYYLDWDQWVSTHAEDVVKLLDQFWTGSGQAADSEVTAALELFGLPQTVSAREIKARYRELISVHHPDRGGDTGLVQDLNNGFVILKRYYGAG
ncbi:MAG TPA: molecular chaperone DnaJ [Pseudomonas xinjiangensis]|uniref:Molecular chaperone DnaJ n=2 Tax=root TaxID=1 RepID=A0A7V1BQA1_9GAMM|nr:molecular chaperone DnaJ [Halopseudomonas xinjiangensis]HEC48816.1 molecular chaperone DnaJ [Halopseudomonas xinjiangensis]